MVIVMKKQDELNLFAMLLERERRVRGSPTNADERTALADLHVCDMGLHLDIDFNRIEGLTHKWFKQGWWDTRNEYPWGYIIPENGGIGMPGDRPCAKFPTTMEAFAGPHAEPSIDAGVELDQLLAKRRERRLVKEPRSEQEASFVARLVVGFEEFMTSFKSKAAAPDRTIQAPMPVSIAMASADPEQQKTFIQHLVASGQKASPATREYLARQPNKDVVIFGRPGAKSLTREDVVRAMNSSVCRDALRILREKGMV